MKADYSKLEEELQATRTRLQSALGAEARALENEKTATERLAASTAERDAAVERARAVCEAHYTAMRRHLEMDWASEREAAARHADEMLAKLRLECAARDKELRRVNQLYQEARLATQHAVESALAETMQEREAERMRFWREELPNQLNTARLAWDQEWSERCAAAVRQVTDTCERKCAMDHGSLHKPDTACCDSQTYFTVTTSNASVCTELASLSSKDVQTDIGCILSLCNLLPAHSLGDVQPDNRLDLRLLPKVFGDYSVQCLQIQLLNSPALSLVRLEELLRTFVSQRLKSYRQRTWNFVANIISQLLDTYHDIGCILSLCNLLPAHSLGDVQPDNRLDLRLLPKVFGDYSVQCLQIQLLNSPALSLVRLEELLRTFVSQRLKSYRQRTWNFVANIISQLLDTYHLNDLLQSSTEMYVSSVNVSLAARVSQSLPCQLPVNVKDTESGVESDIDQSEDQFTRSSIAHRLSQLVVALSELRMELNATREKLETAEKLSEQTAIAGNTTKIYQSTISRIKQEVMTYVQTCQTRAAQTLHSELARVHRRACRQFTAHLRRALCEAGAPLTQFSDSSSSMLNPRVVFPNRRQSNSLPRPTFSTVCCTPPLTSSEYKQVRVGPESDAGDYGPGMLSTVSREPPALPTDLESLLHVIDDVCASAESQFQAGFSTGSAMFERPDKNTPLAAKSLAGSPSHTLPTVVVSTEASSIPSFFGGVKCDSKHNAANDSQLCSPQTEKLSLKWLHKRPSQPEVISSAHKLVRDCTSVSAVPLLNITLAHPVHTCHLVSRSQSATDNTRLSSTHQSVVSTTISPHIPQACVTVRRGPKWETIGHPFPPPRRLRTILSGDSVNVLTTTAVITQTTNTSAALPRHTGQSNAAVLSQSLSRLNPRCDRRQFLHPNLFPVDLPLPVRKRASQ
ncbi:hypothetical protein AHF37_02891 [Paragonimus kellicotti]|nr:hypothetical protein AHF37_02891 [Paragonimus kellicotti]